MILKASRPRARRLTIPAFSAAEFDGCELVDGIPREKAMGARASDIEGNIYSILRNYVLLHRLGRVFPSSTGFHCFPDRPLTVRKPDVAFVAADRLPGGVAPKGFFRIAPDLAVEVVSPRDRAAELETKVIDLLDAGVMAVWIAYPDTRTVHVRTAETCRIIPRDGTIDGGAALPGFSCTIAEFFA
jgi:Uma2 family endonuclease